MLGYSEEELCKFHWDDITHPDDIAVSETPFDLLLKSPGDSYAIETRYVHQDGTFVPVALNVQAGQRDERGRALWFVGFVLNLTGQKAVEQRLRDSRGQLHDICRQTVQALARAIEARDPYTAGHQDNVASFCGRIAAELGLEVQATQGLILAALIHDIGKIGIPADYLSKPTALTEHERAIIQAHAEGGYNILRGITVPWPVAEMVYQHHERRDGSGYPRHLVNGAVLREAQIIAAADMMDSMLNPRPFRHALGVDKTAEALEESKRSKLDGDIVDIALMLLRNGEIKAGKLVAAHAPW
jgi:PAS domain S-box-containing protein/putative nucleotidyltransferase with HDIG domain